jgi:predicted O-methyltransferase YrrM
MSSRIRVGAANESLLGLIRSGVEPFDLIFIDAINPLMSNI